MCLHYELNGLGTDFVNLNVDLVYVAPDGTVFPAFIEGVAGANVTIEATGQSTADIVDAYRMMLGGINDGPAPAEPEAEFMSEEQAAAYVASQPPGNVFIDASGSEWTDIRSEAWRTYIYPDTSEYTVVGPQLLTVKESGSHRVFDDQGQSHWIRGGFTAITWRSKPGKPNFVK